MTPADSIVGGDELTCHTRRSAPSILWIYLTYASVEEPAESVLRGKGKSWRLHKPMHYIQVGELNVTHKFGDGYMPYKVLWLLN